MSEHQKNPKVEFFFREATPWQAAYTTLREIVLGCELTEELKWGVPCYTWQGSNVVLIHGFKEYCALLFHKGALLQDPQGILIQQTANVQAARQIRFTNVQEIVKLESVLHTYINEAIANEKAGRQVTFKATAEFNFPEELLTKLEEVPGLQDAFEALTPGRQRAYVLHFSAPKQAKTREARIAKAIPQILAGKGLQDE
ncbi:MAG: YdeI/OmpD-associated family protein [Caldilineaceae bacterium]|nr:YdeI/OmpD-associated family protein [Caldilineaceae bacterium]